MRFEDLEVWKRSSRLCAEVYKELASLKDFGFKVQITRSSLSIPRNIAEETGKGWINETRDLYAMLVGLIKSKKSKI